jgi:outer membrane protein TolC
MSLRYFRGQVISLSAFVCLVPLVIAAQEQVSPSSSSTSTNVVVIDLPTTLRLANAQNLDVQIAREQLKEAKANHESAMEQFFPWISPGASFRRHENEIQAVDGTMMEVNKQSYTVGGALTAQVDLGDAIYKSLAAKQLITAANHALESQRQDSTLAAAQGYFDLAKARALLDVVNESLRISQNYQDQLHEAVAAGIAFKGDELRVQVQTERYQIALRQTLEQQRVAAADLAQVLHLDPSVELVPQVADLVPLTLVDTNASVDTLMPQALSSRPELKRTQALVSAARDTKNGAVYGPLIPSLEAQAFAGGLGGGKNDSTGNFGESEDYFVGLGWRIGPGGLFDAGRIHASEARLETVRLGGEKVGDEIKRQVVESHARVQSLLDQLGTTKQNLSTASEALRLTLERKQFGVGAVLEVIQAQQDLTRARTDYLNTVAEYNKAEYGLRRAIGGLQAGGARSAYPPTRQ